MDEKPENKKGGLTRAAIFITPFGQVAIPTLYR